MLSVSSPWASAAERGAPRCRLRTTLLPRTSFQVVKPAQAGALTTPPLPNCRAAGGEAFVAYEASSVASALAPWSAVMRPG